MRKLVICVLLGPLLLVDRLSPCRADILVDHPRHNTGGPSADTDFLLDGFIPYWQSLADDFVISTPAAVERVTWLGFYGGQFEGTTLPPTGNETMRVRLFGARPGDGLPGSLLFERDFLNPTRIRTGLTISDTRVYSEYRFEVDLTTPLEIEANTRYWLSIEQAGIPPSHFRWEFSTPTNGGLFASANLDFPGWQDSGLEANLAFQLLGTPEPSSDLLVVIAAIVSPLSMRRGRKRVRAMGA